jgi:hypothetical protein
MVKNTLSASNLVVYTQSGAGGTGGDGGDGGKGQQGGNGGNGVTCGCTGNGGGTGADGGTGGKGGRTAKYPIALLEPGDSFFVEPAEGATVDAIRNTLTSAVSRAKINHPGRNFATRSWCEAGTKGIRVWRTA